MMSKPNLKTKQFLKYWKELLYLIIFLLTLIFYFQSPSPFGDPKSVIEDWKLFRYYVLIFVVLGMTFSYFLKWQKNIWLVIAIACLGLGFCSLYWYSENKVKCTCECDGIKLIGTETSREEERTTPCEILLSGNECKTIDLRDKNNPIWKQQSIDGCKIKLGIGYLFTVPFFSLGLVFLVQMLFLWTKEKMKDDQEADKIKKINMDNKSLFYEHGYALLIGIKYENSPYPLSGTLKDVKDLETHFKDEYKAAYRPENIITIIEKQATAQEILKSLDWLAKKASADANASVVLYFSGHGGKQGDKYFLYPYDFDEGNLIYSTEFAEKISAIAAKKSLVILDCCHAENIPVTKGIGTSADFLNGFIKQVDSVLENDEEYKGVKASSAIEKGIPNGIKKGSGRVILTSCQAHETSLDLGSNGLFTQVLLECLNGIGNIEQDGWVRLIDMIRYVPKNVAERSIKINHKQNPMFKRIENLSAEEFIVCAYKLSDTKEIKHHNKPEKSVDLQEIEKLIADGKFHDAFDILDHSRISNEFGYKRLKFEYAAGLSGIALHDFVQRLLIFIKQFFR